MKRDDVRLHHMLDAARDCVSFVSGKTRADLDTDRVLTLALVMSIGIIGEAANNVSTNTQIELSEIPWSDIIGMRNRVIHAYYDVNIDTLWETITMSLPPLIEVVERFLPQENQ